MVDNDFYKELGGKLRSFRRIRHMTLSDLGRELNKSAATISKYENGEITVSIDILIDLCRILNIDITSLLPRTYTENADTAVSRYAKYFSERLYVYWYNKEMGRVRECVIENPNDSKTSTLYLGSEKADDFRRADYLYTGNAECSDTNTLFLYRNIMPPFDTIFISLSSVFKKNSTRVGIMSCITSYYQNVAVKILASNTRLQNIESLREQLTYNSEDIRNLRRTNFFIV